MTDPIEKLLSELELKKPSPNLDQSVLASLREIKAGDTDPELCEDSTPIDKAVEQDLLEVCQQMHKPSDKLDERIFASMRQFDKENIDNKVSSELDKRIHESLSAIQYEIDEQDEKTVRQFPIWSWIAPLASAACLVLFFTIGNQTQTPTPQVAQEENPNLYILQEVPTEDYITPDDSFGDNPKTLRRWVDNRNGYTIEQRSIPVKGEIYE